ncbi:hypothetical protein ACP275_04G191200 [Erythranthe tilingii]
MALQKFLAKKLERVDTKYFQCEACNTHIALAEDIYFFIPGERIIEHGMVFHKLANVRIDEPINHHQLGRHTVADIYCIRCGNKLGWKYIKVCGLHIHHHAGSNYTLRDNMMKLLMSKLLQMSSPGLDYTAPPVMENKH